MNFKVLIVGQDSVGKGSFIHMCKTGKFDNIGPLSTYLDCRTNYGIIRLQFTQSRTYEEGHDIDLIMFDVSRPSTLGILDNIPSNKTPKIIVGNKFDLAYINRYRKKEILPKGYKYYNTSAKTFYGIICVILNLLKMLVATNIKFV